MTIFNSYVKLPEGRLYLLQDLCLRTAPRFAAISSKRRKKDKKGQPCSTVLSRWETDGKFCNIISHRIHVCYIW